MADDDFAVTRTSIATKPRSKFDSNIVTYSTVNVTTKTTTTTSTPTTATTATTATTTSVKDMENQQLTQTLMIIFLATLAFLSVTILCILYMCIRRCCRPSRPKYLIANKFKSESPTSLTTIYANSNNTNTNEGSPSGSPHAKNAKIHTSPHENNGNANNEDAKVNIVDNNGNSLSQSNKKLNIQIEEQHKHQQRTPRTKVQENKRINKQQAIPSPRKSSKTSLYSMNTPRTTPQQKHPGAKKRPVSNYSMISNQTNPNFRPITAELIKNVAKDPAKTEIILFKAQSFTDG